MNWPKVDRIFVIFARNPMISGHSWRVSKRTSADSSADVKRLNCGSPKRFEASNGLKTNRIRNVFILFIFYVFCMEDGAPSGSPIVPVDVVRCILLPLVEFTRGNDEMSTII